jgi:hypothetical protein
MSHAVMENRRLGFFILKASTALGIRQDAECDDGMRSEPIELKALKAKFRSEEAFLFL